MSSQETTCYRHPGQRAGVTCQRCDRPICPQCMNSASVGFQCPECARSGRQRVYQGAAAISVARGRPIVTMVLIGINVAVYVLGLGFKGAESFSTRGGLIGEAGLGTAQGFTLIGVGAGEWYRIFTSGFLHENLIHLGFNMFALWLLGSMLEPSLGKAEFLSVYVTALVAGSFGVLLLDPHALTVGASGAVFGLMGAAVVAQRSTGVNPWQSGIGTFLVINLVLTFTIPGISIGGHLGGLIGGAVAGAVVVWARPQFKSPAVAVGLNVAVSAALFYGCLAIT